MQPLLPIVFPAGRIVDPRIQAAADRHRLECVDGDRFDETYDFMAACFGPLGEIEPREVLRAEIETPRFHGQVGIDYQLVRVVDLEGELVAVIDGRYAFGPDLILGLGSNITTDPARRGDGVGAAVDLSTRLPFLARSAARLGRSPDLPCVIVADLDPYDPDVPESLARMRLWGRCGWTVIPPAALPFALLGQADPDRPGELLGPTPNLLMARGPEATRLTSLPRSVLRSMVDLLAAVSHGHAPAHEVEGWATHARSAVDRWPDHDVALLPLPGRDPTPEVLAAVGREALLDASDRQAVAGLTP
ncbi:MAG: hypothetical protein H6738_15170 [Alphaproteobacteria bacterium]|nr:hypothetical protein [Alphaproteobacteria bacterium]MCB9698118.1 hypothetical protein [Alphaproteobacteria bacterium]